MVVGRSQPELWKVGTWWRWVWSPFSLWYSAGWRDSELRSIQVTYCWLLAAGQLKTKSSCKKKNQNRNQKRAEWQRARVASCALLPSLPAHLLMPGDHCRMMHLSGLVWEHMHIVKVIHSSWWLTPRISQYLTGGKSRLSCTDILVIFRGSMR